jgi:hypothetical protein
VPPAPWLDDAGLVTLPGGARVRGRRLRDHAVPADFTLVLAKGPVTDRPHRRALAGERVEVACGGGVGRTGTALAALAMLDGLAAHEAIGWVRSRYHPRAVETPWQRWWLRGVR